MLLRVSDSDFLTFSLEHTKTKLVETMLEGSDYRDKNNLFSNKSKKLLKGESEPFPTKFLFNTPSAKNLNCHFGCESRERFMHVPSLQ